MRTRLAPSVVLAVAALAFTPQVTQAELVGTASDRVEVRLRLRVIPDHVSEARSPMLDGVDQWARLAVRVDGRLAPIVVHRHCAAELVTRRVLVTVDSCGTRIVVRAATTGDQRRMIRVSLRSTPMVGLGPLADR